MNSDLTLKGKHFIIVGASSELALNIAYALDHHQATYDVVTRKLDRICPTNNCKRFIHYDPLQFDTSTFCSEYFNSPPYALIYLAAMRDIQSTSWHDVYLINHKTYAELRIGLSPLMAKAGGGRFLAYSSSGSKYGGGENKTNYTLSKQLLESFTKEDKKMASNNILTNVIQLGVLNSNKSVNPHRLDLIPTKSLIPITEVSFMSLLLCSPKNTCITCSTICMTGGE